MAKKTYTMIACCLNCGTEFTIEIEKGSSTFYHWTKCPYCGQGKVGGVSGSFIYTKPEGKHE